MKARARLLCALVSLLVAGALSAACAHGVIQELPAAPTAPAPRLTRLAITPVGGGTLPVGGSAPIVSSGVVPSLGALAQYSDGTFHYVEAAWSTSDPTVIVIEGHVMRAAGPGTATVTAVAEGLTATETFRVESR